MSNNDLYKDLPERINTILGEDPHLHRLKQLSDAGQAFKKEIGLAANQHLPTEQFANWLLERWGLELKYNVPAQGLAGFDVVDEQKYLLFCMVFP